MLWFLLAPACVTDVHLAKEQEDEDSPAADSDAECDPTASRRCWQDADGDGFGAGEVVEEPCGCPEGWVGEADQADCDDADPDASPDGTEACGGGDEDCDGLTDEGDAEGAAPFYADTDGDGFGDPEVTDLACAPTDDLVADATDCDDQDATVSPAATEACGDGADDDCDGSADEGCGPVGLVDFASSWAAVTLDDYPESSAIVGDSDGDGVAELVVGTPMNDDGATEGGAVWLVDLAGAGDVPVTDGVQLTGSTASGWMGFGVGGVDADADGLSDIAYGGLGTDVFVAFGPVAAGAAEAVADVRITDVLGTNRSVRGLPDVSGDGVADFAFGGGWSAAYVAFGPLAAGTFTAADLADVTRISSYAWEVEAVDGDGDGDRDVLISGGGDPVLLDPLDGSTLATFTGDMMTGFLVAAGDLDGDGQGDVVLGDDYGNPWGLMAGAVYVSYGPFSGTIAVSDTTGSLADGVVHGTGADDWLAYRHAISVPGDVDGDGADDLVLGAGGYDPAGVTALFYGPILGDHAIDAGDALWMDAGTQTGWTVGRGGDADADGLADVVVWRGTPNALGIWRGAAR